MSRRDEALLTAFDADVLIYAAHGSGPLGSRIKELFREVPTEEFAGMGSVLLGVEVLAKPLREEPGSLEARELFRLLGRLDLRAFRQTTADLALSLAVTYGFRAADAAHLATAVENGASRFLTNNHKDFPKTINEIDIMYPDDLPRI